METLLTNTYDRIADAIRNRRIIRASYRGGERLLCPHALGTKRGERRRMGKRGKLIGKDRPNRTHVLSYQFGGYSRSGLMPDGHRENWRCMNLDEVTVVAVEVGAWHTAPNHTRPNSCLDVVDVEVEH